MRDVRKLVILDWLLTGTGERWTEERRPPVRGGPGTGQGHPGEPADRAARGAAPCDSGGLRRGQGDAGNAGRGHVAGQGAGQPGPVVRAGRPVGADLGAAFRNLVDQAFAAPTRRIPASSRATPRSSVRDLLAVYAHVERAVADPEGRVRLEGDVAAVRRVANVLGVGYAAETHFLFGDDRFAPWAAEFERAVARDGIRPQDTVDRGKRLRKWIDAMTPPYGLRDEVADLVILAWAALRTRAWYLHGGPVPPPRPGAVRPEMELRPEPLPAPADWTKATSRAEALFGLHVNPYLNATAVAELVESIRGRVDVCASSAPALVPELEQAYRRIGLAVGQQDRIATARAAAELIARLQHAAAAGNRVRLVQTLARTTLPGTEASLARSLRQASAVREALHGFRWERLAPLREAATRAADERDRSAARIIATLRDALAADEIAQALGQALSDDRGGDLRLADRRPATSAATPAATSAARSWPGPGHGGTERRRHPGRGCPDQAILSELGAFLRDHRGEQVVVEWRIVE